jgi:hypothetical protein
MQSFREREREREEEEEEKEITCGVALRPINSCYDQYNAIHY